MVGELQTGATTFFSVWKMGGRREGYDGKKKAAMTMWLTWSDRIVQLSTKDTTPSPYLLLLATLVSIKAVIILLNGFEKKILVQRKVHFFTEKKKMHTGSPKSFLAGLLLIRSFLTCTDTEGYPDPGAAPCSWFPCTSVSFRIIAFPSTVLGYFRISKLILYLH